MQLTIIIIQKLAAMSFTHVHLNIGNSRGGAKKEASPIFLYVMRGLTGSKTVSKLFNA